jgi:hypothetical protein
MTSDKITRLARQAGLPETDVEGVFRVNSDDLGRMLAIEREACANICRSEAERALWNFKNDLPQNESFWNGAEQMASSCERLIKGRVVK